MKKVIKMTESQLKKMVQDTINEQQSIGEYHNEFNDDDDYNELDSLFIKNFDTEDDYDGEMLRGDDEGFSNKMREKQIQKKLKLNSVGIGDDHYFRKKEVEIPRDKEGKEVKYSPLRNDDLPLDKYLEKKKTNSLDEDEDIAMLDDLLKKNEPSTTEINEESVDSYEQIKSEWSKVNSDEDTSTQGFGEGKSPNESTAIKIAQMKGRTIVAKKSAGLKPSDTNPFEGSVSASEVKGKMYRIGNMYEYICVMDKN